jgi:acyl dehydratase
MLVHDIVNWENVRMGVNYGLDKVRFPSPVPVGSTLRLGIVLVAAEPLRDDGVQVALELTFEVEGAAKPACVAELLLRYYFNP